MVIQQIGQYSVKLCVLYPGTAAKNTHKGSFHLLFASYQSDLTKYEIVSVLFACFIPQKTG